MKSFHFYTAAACAVALLNTSSAWSAPVAAAPTSPGVLQWQPLYEPGSGGAMVDIAVSPFDSKRILVAGDMLGIGLSTDRGESWQSTFGFKTWEMASFTWHPTKPNVIWVGSMSGPYLSNDGGRNWVQKRVGMPGPAGFGYSVPIEKVLYDPQDANHLLAFGGSSRHWDFTGQPLRGVIWESRDGGEKWSRLVTITPAGFSATEDKGDNITFAAYAGGSKTRLYAMADKAGFLVSEDGGKTWARRNEGLPFGDISRVAVHPTNPNIAWVSVDNRLPEGAKERIAGGVYKTTDGGLHWAESSNGLGKTVTRDDYNLTSHYRALAVSRTNPSVLYTNDFAYTTGVTYKSEDGGASWRPVVSKQNIGTDNNDPLKRRAFQIETAMPGGLGLANITIDPRDPNAAYGFNTETISRTLDGGKTWNDATAQKIGTAWRGRGYSGWVSTNFRFNPFKRGQSIFQGMDASRLWISDDSLRSWRYPLGEPDAWNGGRDATFTRDGHIYATTGTFNFTGIARSPDGGKTWTVLSGAARGLPEFYKGSAPGGIYALPDNSKVWAVVNGALLSSVDGGEKWQTALEAPGLQWIAADPKNPRRIFVSGDKNVYRSDDASTWTPIGGPHKNGWMAVDALGRLLVAAEQTDRSGLWRYDPKAPADSRWSRLLDENWIGGCAVDPSNPSRIAVSTNQNPYSEVSAATGVWISTDDGRSWSQQNTGLAMTRGLVVAFNPFDPTQLVFGSNGRGFFQARWPKTLTPAGRRSSVQVAEDARFAAVYAPPVFKVSVLNGGMTQGGQVPANWGGKDGDITVTRDTTTFKSGPASLQVLVAGGKSGSASQTFQGGAGASFKLAGWIKSQGNVKAQVAVQAFAEGYKNNQFIQVQYIQNDTDWTAFEKEVKLPDWTAFFDVKLLVEGDGKAWIDDVHEAAAPVDAGNPADAFTTGPPAKDKPSVAGWGFYPQFAGAWMSTHNGLLGRTKQGREKKDIHVIFLGDSITQGWTDPNGGKSIFDKLYAPLGAVNYGIGGDSTRQVLWRIQNGEVDGLAPRLVVLKIGTNNLYGDNNAGSDEDIAAGITTIVSELRKRLPNTKILLLGVLPRQNDYFSKRAANINKVIAKLDNGETVRFLDMSDKFQTEVGKVKPELFGGDQLHINTAGYQMWADTMQPLFEQMLR